MKTASINKILCNRNWNLRLSLYNRKCYISGRSLWWALAYKGTRTGMNSKDTIWLSKDEYLKNLANNNL